MTATARTTQDRSQDTMRHSSASVRRCAVAVADGDAIRPCSKKTRQTPSLSGLTSWGGVAAQYITNDRR